MLGWIGLGIMGKPMAKNLVKAGFGLMVNDLDQEAVKELVEDGALSGSYREIGEQCDAVILILPNGGIVQDVIVWKEGVAETLSSGKTVCDMSSVTADESMFCFRKLKEMGVGFLDAPVSGGEPGAIAGTLAIMCGGEEKDFETMKPYFDVLGSSALFDRPQRQRKRSQAGQPDHCESEYRGGFGGAGVRGQGWRGPDEDLSGDPRRPGGKRGAGR